MSDTPTDSRRDVALFRYGVIAELLSLPPASPELKAALGEKVQRRYTIPGSRRTRVARETIRDWLAAYRRDGFDGLVPKTRSDFGRARRLPPDVAELLIRLKERHPRLSADRIIRLARESGQVPAEQTLAQATVYRLFRREGLMRRAGQPAEAKDRRRFAFRQAGELWMSDVLHGPKAGRERSDRRQRAKSYLVAFLDDATRMVPHAAFTFSENTDTFLPVFKRALLKRGIPNRLYVDNGANYRSRHLAVICATLGIQLIHSAPYQPAGRGKIERFFRTVRAQFLPLLGDADTRSLDALNARWAAWCEGEYHLSPHRGLDGETPVDAWARTAAGIRLVGPATDLDTLFRYRLKRRVGKDRTVSLQGTLYEVDAALVGENVLLLQDPSAPRSRPIPVLHDGRAAGTATLLDTYANTRVKRARTPHGPDRARDAAPEPPPSPIRLRDLRPATPETD